MRKLTARTAILLAAAAVVVGLAGAYSYAREYALRRGVATLGPLPRAGAGRLLPVEFYSAALHRRADYLVYLPSAYDPSRPLPVFYMLHGMPGRPLAFTVNADVETKLDELISSHRVQPMILVFPDGRIGGQTGTDSEWANTGAGDFESYVVDVVHDVDHRFATLPYRQDRAIAGLSAGAYGAANIGLHQVALFGLIQVWSGYFIQTRTGVFSQSTRAWLEYNSPLEYVHTMKRALATYPLRVFLYVGNHDGDASPVAPMAAALAAAGAKVRSAVYPGGHDWNLWSARMDQMLSMASHYFSRG
jgi:enterochelin esterase-like enzyme